MVKRFHVLFPIDSSVRHFLDEFYALYIPVPVQGVAYHFITFPVAEIVI